MDGVLIRKVFKPIDLAAEDDALVFGEPVVRQVLFDLDGEVLERARVVENALEHGFATVEVTAFLL